MSHEVSINVDMLLDIIVVSLQSSLLLLWHIFVVFIVVLAWLLSFFHSNHSSGKPVIDTRNRFSAVGPRLWNDLPPGLRRPGLTFDSFKKS